MKLNFCCCRCAADNVVRPLKDSEIELLWGSKSSSGLAVQAGKHEDLAGVYENRQYEGSDKNDWHFVTITRLDDRLYRWWNKADVSWTLERTGNPDVFLVRADCPYYAEPEGRHHRVVRVIRSNGKIVHITGPYDESYHRDNDSSPIAVGTKCPLAFDELCGLYMCGKVFENRFRVVLISQVSDDLFMWQNLAGQRWTLKRTSNPNLYEVLTDSQSHSRGRRSLVIGRNSAGQIEVIGERGCPKYYRQKISMEVLSQFDAQDDDFEGIYENREYDEKGKNDWHFVTITKCIGERGSYLWQNLAGASWTLERTLNRDMFLVHPNCPYYNEASECHHRVVNVTRSNGRIVHISGPFEEQYNRQDYFSVERPFAKANMTNEICGVYECHKYDKRGKNDWHYVSISRSSDNHFTWKNRAGFAWTIKRTHHPNLYVVLDDCPYHSTGHCVLKIVRGDDGRIAHVHGPWFEIYRRES